MLSPCSLSSLDDYYPRDLHLPRLNYLADLAKSLSRTTVWRKGYNILDYTLENQVTTVTRRPFLVLVLTLVIMAFWTRRCLSRGL